MKTDGRRISDHPVLGPCGDRKPVTIFFNGAPIRALEGDTIADALIAAGVRVFHYSYKRHEPRGPFCAIGHCMDCIMRVDGVDGVKTCMTKVRDGMKIEREE